MPEVKDNRLHLERAAIGRQNSFLVVSITFEHSSREI
jgi:hypothetical protein